MRDLAHARLSSSLCHMKKTLHHHHLSIDAERARHQAYGRAHLACFDRFVSAQWDGRSETFNRDLRSYAWREINAMLTGPTPRTAQVVLANGEASRGQFSDAKDLLAAKMKWRLSGIPMGYQAVKFLTTSALLILLVVAGEMVAIVTNEAVSALLRR